MNSRVLQAKPTPRLALTRNFLFMLHSHLFPKLRYELGDGGAGVGLAALFHENEIDNKARYASAGHRHVNGMW